MTSSISISLREEIKQVPGIFLSRYDGDLLKDFEYVNKCDEQFQKEFQEAKIKGTLKNIKNMCESTRKEWESMRKKIEKCNKELSIHLKNQKHNDYDRKQLDKDMKDFTNNIKKIEDGYKTQEKLTK